MEGRKGGRDRQAERKDGGGMGMLERCSGRAGLPGVWGEEAVAMEGPVELFLPRYYVTHRMGGQGWPPRLLAQLLCFPDYKSLKPPRASSQSLRRVALSISQAAGDPEGGAPYRLPGQARGL